MRVAACEVVVDSHGMHAVATQREPGCGQGAGESLALTGGHLDNVSLHERQRALQLHIEGAHGQGALGDFAERG